MREDPAYARLFDDLKNEFTDVAATVAVMPFVNVAGNPDDLWMVRGLVETLSADLPKMGFTVVERDRLDALLQEDERGQVLSPDTTRALGQKAGADFLLLGSVLREGEHLRIDARFVDVRTGVIAFSTTVEDRRGDYMALLQGLSVMIAERFNAKLSEATLASLSSKKMSKADFEKYMRQELSKDRLKASMRPTSVKRGPSRAPFWVAVAGAIVGTGVAVTGLVLADRFSDQAAYNYALGAVSGGTPAAVNYEENRRIAATNTTIASAFGYSGVGVAALSVAFLVYDEIVGNKARAVRIDATVNAQGGSLGVAGAF